MLDGLWKDKIDRTWDRLAQPLARAGISPNQVTTIGLLLVAANCGLYLLHPNDLLFGVGLAISFACDSLDGAVARAQGSASKFGGYFDAVIDRYQEILVSFVLGWMNGWWVLIFFVTTGSLLTSYNKARTAVEIPIDNAAWPDMIERLERIVVVCGALILNSFIALPAWLGGNFLHAVLVILAVLTHLTALQRFARARALLLREREH